MKLARGWIQAGVLVACASLASSVHAQSKPTPSKSNAVAPAPKLRHELPVLSLATDDADDQAEAMSGALRSRLREKPGIVVDDTTTNLATLMAALGCSQRPDPLCLLKIGDQLKVERFVWGNVKKGPERGQVTAEVHLWRRGKADQSASESFSENLRDQNDDVLRRIAGKIIDRLMGQQAAAAVTIRAGDGGGEVIIDNKDHAQLERGETVVELYPGRHVVEVRVPGYRPSIQSVDVTAANDQLLGIRLVTDDGTEKPAPTEPGKPISPRTIASYGLLVVGAGFAIAGTVKAAQFFSLRDQNKQDAKALNAQDFCNLGLPHQSDAASLADACDRRTRAEDARKMEIVFYGVAALATGAGVVLLLTDHSGDSGAKDRAGELRVVPSVGKNGGSVDLSLKF